MSILKFFGVSNSFKNLGKYRRIEKELYQVVIDGVIDANSSSDLKVLLDKINKYDWMEKSRYFFLLGLLQGSLMQYNKQVSIDELKTLFRKI